MVSSASFFVLIMDDALMLHDHASKVNPHLLSSGKHYKSYIHYKIEILPAISCSYIRISYTPGSHGTFQTETSESFFLEENPAFIKCHCVETECK